MLSRFSHIDRAYGADVRRTLPLRASVEASFVHIAKSGSFSGFVFMEVDGCWRMGSCCPKPGFSQRNKLGDFESRV
jgi:hypothetical protein